MNLDTLIIELRGGAESERDFAKRIALVCAELADRSLAEMDQSPSTAIRKLFELE